MLKEKGTGLSAEEYLQDLGRKLYVKITEVIQTEIEEVREEDCIDYIYNLVLNRTFDWIPYRNKNHIWQIGKRTWSFNQTST
jgi:hypothetical protein